MTKLLEEILEDGKSGILFDVGDYDKLAQIMEDIENKNIDSKVYINKAVSSLSRFNKDNFIILDQFDYIDTSSTDVRNGNYEELNPEVKKYIDKYKLYR